MSLFHSIIGREIGLRNSFDYDSILPRLTVSKADTFYGISPNVSRLDYNPFPPLFACKFAETAGYEHIAVLANEDGRVAIQNVALSKKDEDERTVFRGQQCHSNAVFDLAWMPKKLSFVTASGDHSARLWDIGSETFKLVQEFHSHTRSVRTVAFRPDDSSVFATGARDGRVLLWDTRVNSNVSAIWKPDNSINNCHPLMAPRTPGSSSKKSMKVLDRTNSITGVVFQDDYNLITCGASDGSIRVWDLRRNYSTYKKDPLPKHSIPYCGSSNKNGYSSLVLDRSKVRLFASCMDNVIYCFNVATYNTLPIQKYVGFENGSFYIKSSVSPDCKYLISGSSDGNAYVWNVKYRDPIVKLTGHEAEVTCASWCQVGDIKIVTCSDDSRHKVWRVGKEVYDDYEASELTGKSEQIPSIERTNRLHWAMLDRTPQASKRKLCDSGCNSAKRRTPMNGIDSDTQIVPLSRKKSKRSLMEMLNNSLLTTIEETSPKKRMNSNNSDIENYPSTSSVNDGYGTPIVFDGKVLDSPTLNLPNYVTDGKAPHLRVVSPQKKRPKIDWLTRLTMEKNEKLNAAKNTNSTDEVKSVEKRKCDKTLLHFFTNAATEKTETPLSDKTNKQLVSSKRKAAEETSCPINCKRSNNGKASDESDETEPPKNEVVGVKSQTSQSNSKCKNSNSLLSYFIPVIESEKKA